MKRLRGSFKMSIVHEKTKVYLSQIKKKKKIIKDFLQTQQRGSLFNSFNVPNEGKVKRYKNIANLRNKFKIIPYQI